MVWLGTKCSAGCTVRQWPMKTPRSTRRSTTSARPPGASERPAASCHIARSWMPRTTCGWGRARRRRWTRQKRPTERSTDEATPFERPPPHRPRDVASPPRPRPSGCRRRRRAVRLGQVTGGAGAREGAGRPGPPSRWHPPEEGPYPVRPAHGLRQDQRARLTVRAQGLRLRGRPTPRAGREEDRHTQGPQGRHLRAARPHRVPVRDRQARAQRPQDVVPDRQGRDALGGPRGPYHRGPQSLWQPQQGSIPMRPRLRRRFDGTKPTELAFCALLTSASTPAWEKAQVWARRSNKAERRRKEFLLSSRVPESPVSVLWYSLITSWRDPEASFARSGGG